ncbi:MAG: hypothetical protein WBN09_14005, partial [Woeseiaceae bacterium]
ASQFIERSLLLFLVCVLVFCVDVRNGSLAELNDTPKAAVRAAAIEGIADLAIRRKRPFVSGNF